MDRKPTVVLIALAVLVFSPLVDSLRAQDSRPRPNLVRLQRERQAKRTPRQLRILFRDVASEIGVTTTAPNTNTDRRYVLETAGGGGIALFDCDNDGKLDLAVVNDSTIEQYRKGGDLMITLYRQDGNGSALHFHRCDQGGGPDHARVGNGDHGGRLR